MALYAEQTLFGVVHKVWQSLNDRAWQEKCADASVGQDMTKVQMFHNGMWHEATLKNVC